MIGPLDSIFQQVAGRPMMLAMLGLGLLALAWFMRLERSGRAEIVLAVVVATVLLEMYLFASQNRVPPGVFRPGPASLRLPELIILAGLAARFLVRGLPRRVSVEGMLWAAFLTWYGASVVVGLMHGNAFELALFHFRAVLYLGGGWVLAAGIPAERLVGRRTLFVGAVAVGLPVVASIGPTMARTPWQLDLPLAPGGQLGDLGADLASAVVALAVIALCVEAARKGGRQWLVIAASIAMLLVPLAVGQRAAVIGAAVTLVLVVALSASWTWRRRTTVTAVDLGVLLLALVIPVAVSAILSGLNPPEDPGERAAPIPFAGALEDSFFATRKVQSAQTRLNLWDDGMARIRDKPLVGSGLGTEYRVERAAVDEDLVGGGFHNVMIDVAVRSGVVGLVLFGVSLTAIVWRGVVVWRRHPNDQVAALTIGVLIALAGLAAKGMAESVLEKYRLMALIGLMIGVIGSAARSLGSGTEHQDVPAPEPVRAREVMGGKA